MNCDHLPLLAPAYEYILHIEMSSYIVDLLNQKNSSSATIGY